MIRPARFLFPVLLAVPMGAQAQTTPLILPDVPSFEQFVGLPVSIQFSVQNPPTGGISGGWAITSGSLPAGLSLSAGGLLTGTPTTPQSVTFTVTTVYTFPVGAAPVPPLVLSRTYQFNVDNRLLIITSSPLPPATAGAPVNYVILSNMPAAWSYEVSDLPSTININLPQSSTAMTLTGFFPPGAGPGPYSIDLYAFGGTYISQSDHRVFQITVNPAPTISGPSPTARVGTPYASSVSVAGGTPPYVFGISSGSLPPGLLLDPKTGSITGTPLSSGRFDFTGVVTDANGAIASAPFTIQVAPPPLSMITSTLPGGIVGTAYSATFAATGGSPPYTWSVSSGSLPPGLTLDAATGALSGAPSSAGTFNFIVSVADSAQETVLRPFTVRVIEPLRILTTALSEGTEGMAYSAVIEAAGGTPPYVFTLAAGSLPAGLALSIDGRLSGTPAESGVFPITVRVTDSGQLSTERPFTLTVLLRPSILTGLLPDGRVGDPYEATLTAQGRPPFSWSVSGGNLPPGLMLDPQSGTIRGTPTQPGQFSFEVTVSDGNQPALSASRAFSVSITLPPLPNLTLTQLEETSPPAAQPTFGLLLSGPFPLELNGTVTLSFAPDGNLPPDPAIRFSNGGTQVNFTIPAGQTSAVPAPGSLFAFQTGTTAGTITLTVTLRLGPTVLEPAPFLTRQIRIQPSGPVVTNVTIVRTAAGFEIRVSGYANTRQVSGATFRFVPFPGAALGTSEVSPPVASAFQSWFASQESRQYGGQFLLTVPFTVQGSFGALASVQVTLTNSAGSGTASANF